jgi:membrane protein YqaA with SNARE-associated domain
MHSLLQQYQMLLLALGPLGMFAVGVIESCSIPIPLELLLIPLVASRPERMLAYVLLATAASVLGSLLIFALARKLGSNWVERRLPEHVYRRVHHAVETYDVLAIGVPALLPPFFPFMAFVMVAGLFRMSWTGFVVPMFVGRSIRYYIEVWLALRYGSRALTFLARHPVASVAVLTGVLAVGFAFGRWRAGRLAKMA